MALMSALSGMRCGTAMLGHPGLKMQAKAGMHASIRALPSLRGARSFAKKGSKPGEGPLDSSGLPPPPTPGNRPPLSQPAPPLGTPPTSPNQPAQDWIEQQARSQAAAARAEQERRKAVQDAADAGREAASRTREAAQEAGDTVARAADDATGAAQKMAAGLAGAAFEVASDVADAAGSASNALDNTARDAEESAASSSAAADWRDEASVQGNRLSPGANPVRVGSPPPPPPPSAPTSPGTSRVVPITGKQGESSPPPLLPSASSAPPPPSAGSPSDDGKLASKLREKLLELLPSLDRGVAAGPDVAARVESLAAQLAAAGGPVILTRQAGYGAGSSASDSALQQLGGRWRLVYSSAFARAGRLTLPLPLPANAGQIYQDIYPDTNELDNVLELLSPISLVSVIPGLSGSRPTATVRLRHSFVLEGPSALKLTQTSAEVRPSGGLQGWLDSVPTITPPSLPQGIRSRGSTTFEIMYLKDDLRISRSKGGIRVFLRGQA